MKRAVLFLALGALMAALPIRAQESMGFDMSRWGGVLSVAQNPANAFSYDLKTGVHLFAVAAGARNNYLTMRPGKLLAGADASEALEANPKGSSASAMIAVDATGPSFLIRLSAADALAFSIRDRTLVNIDDIPLEAANMLYDSLVGSGANNYSFSGDYFSVNANNWLEYGLTYGRRLFARGPHEIKAGATLKLLQGVGAYTLTVRNFQSRLEIANDLIDQVTAEIYYGHTQNLTWGNDGNSLFAGEAMGVGLDFGVVYEYHPERPAAGKAVRGGPPESGDYRLKIGLALLDLGAVRYAKKLGSRDFDADVDVLDIVVFETLENQADINDVINGINGVTPRPGDSGKFAMDLPARINAFADLRVGGGVYVNLNPVIALSGGRSDPQRTHQQTQLNFSLRVDKPMLGVFVPGAVGGLGGFRLGLGVKAGPLLIGSSSLLGVLFGQPREADFFLGLSLPIL